MEKLEWIEQAVEMFYNAKAIKNPDTGEIIGELCSYNKMAELTNKYEIYREKWES